MTTQSARHTLRRSTYAGAVVLTGLAVACEPSPVAQADTQRAAATAAGTPTAAGANGGVIDSIIPIDEALRRFRADLPVVTALSGGAPSRDALVDQFARAVTRRDTVAIRTLVLSRAEFAYLYYPSTRYTHKPYEMAPALLWFLAQQNGEKGVKRVLQRYGGQSLAMAGYTCADAPRREGENVLWVDCRVRSPRVADPGGTRLFGAIIERGGRYKFVSYANDL